MAAFVVSACSGAHSAKRASRPSTTTTTTTTATTAATAATSTTSRPGTPLCATAGLAISTDGEGAALGHGGVAVHFRNTGTATCRLTGYPGVAALDAAGRQAAQADRTPSGYIGGLAPDNQTPPIVDVARGETATALVETTHVSSDPAPCPQYAGLLVTPPGETHSVRLTVGFSGCTIQVHPVVPGDIGSEGR
jgi:uncharacterized protein DUF4232